MSVLEVAKCKINVPVYLVSEESFSWFISGCFSVVFSGGRKAREFSRVFIRTLITFIGGSALMIQSPTKDSFQISPHKLQHIHLGEATNFHSIANGCMMLPHVGEGNFFYSAYQFKY